MKSVSLAVACIFCLLYALAVGRMPPVPPDAARAADPAKETSPKARLDQLQAEIKRLDALAPDQAAVMSHLGYHWSNLWFALEQENWPLADFYLAETRSNLKWAIRVKPERVVNKEKVDLKSIAQALDGTQLAQLQTAIARKEKGRCVKLYDEALQGCYACHKASEKPYLRPQRPAAPEVRVINFDPDAKKPE
jgi:hypothetical protein